MRRNRLRERLRAGQPTLGTHIHSAWPAVVELAGHAGCFDYVEFVGEYAPYDLFALENLARAVNTFDHMSAMFKVEQQPRTYLAVRAIGAGIQNLLFADPRKPDDVRECVRSVRAETPEAGGPRGTRKAGPAPAAGGAARGARRAPSGVRPGRAPGAGGRGAPAGGRPGHAGLQARKDPRPRRSGARPPAALRGPAPRGARAERGAHLVLRRAAPVLRDQPRGRQPALRRDDARRDLGA